MAKLNELAVLVSGQVEGDGSVNVCRVLPIDQAGRGDITFVSNPKYITLLKDSEASAVILPPGIDAPGRNVIRCRNPYLAFAKILTFLQVPELPVKGILPGAFVADSAQIGNDVTIYPGAVIGDNVVIGDRTTIYGGVIVYDNVQIGDNCILHAQSIIREGCQLGNRVILQPSAVIGSDGFGFAPDGTSYFKIPQVGIVVLEDDVEIGASSCIDRAALGKTIIKRGTKLDNLIQIGHNVEIGEDCVIVSQVGIAGSSKIGNHCTFGGQSAVAGHLKVGDNVMLGARSGVSGNVDSDQVLSGVPLMPHKEWLRATMTLPKLPEMRKEMVQLKKRIELLEGLLKED